VHRLTSTEKDILNIMAGLEPKFESLLEVGRIRNRARSTILAQYYAIQDKLRIVSYGDIAQWAIDHQVELNEYHRS